MHRNNHVAVIITLFVLALIGILASNSTLTANAAETNATVDVNVSTLSEITVFPNNINWTLITPGQNGGVRLLDIKNTGSVNVTNLYSYVTTLANETVRPYGSSNPANYSAGGVLVFKNSTSQYFWAGRLEWNWTAAISNLDLSNIPATSRAAQGYYRNASNSYVWALGNGTSGLCNNSNALFAITDMIDLGTAATRKPDPTSISMDGGDANYGYFSINRGANFLNGMCVAVDQNCTKIFVYKFDRRPGFTTCANSQYIRAANLTPDAIETVTADVWIPKGMPAGNLTQAIWSFVAT